MKSISAKVEEKIKDKLIKFANKSKRTERLALEYLIDNYLDDDGNIKKGE